MATKTAGTLATTTLTAVQFSPAPSVLSDADLATVAAGVTRDTGQYQPPGSTGGPEGFPSGGGGNAPGATAANISPGAVNRTGMVHMPGGRTRHAPITAQPGDWICNDGFGNVFVIPQRALPKTVTLAGCTATSGSPTIVAPSDIRALGWQVGTHVTGVDVPAGSVIGNIRSDGLSFDLITFSTGAKVNATGSGTVTLTAGTFTHS